MQHDVLFIQIMNKSYRIFYFSMLFSRGFCFFVWKKKMEKNDGSTKQNTSFFFGNSLNFLKPGPQECKTIFLLTPAAVFTVKQLMDHLCGMNSCHAFFVLFPPDILRTGQDPDIPGDLSHLNKIDRFFYQMRNVIILKSVIIYAEQIYKLSY